MYTIASSRKEVMESMRSRKIWVVQDTLAQCVINRFCQFVNLVHNIIYVQCRWYTACSKRFPSTDGQLN